jgi:histidinol-phosphate/aromatic aminotransferase/cobyric acid decarboxylase-like protein
VYPIGLVVTGTTDSPMNKITPKTRQQTAARKLPETRKEQTAVTAWIARKAARTIKKVGKQNKRSFASQSAFVLEEYAADMADTK